MNKGKLRMWSNYEPDPIKLIQQLARARREEKNKRPGIFKIIMGMFKNLLPILLLSSCSVKEHWEIPRDWDYIPSGRCPVINKIYEQDGYGGYQFLVSEKIKEDSTKSTYTLIYWSLPIYLEQNQEAEEIKIPNAYLEEDNIQLGNWKKNSYREL